LFDRRIFDLPQWIEMPIEMLFETTAADHAPLEFRRVRPAHIGNLRS